MNVEIAIINKNQRGYLFNSNSSSQFIKILTQIRTLKNNNRIVKSILHKDIIPQIYNNKYDEIIGYLYIDKKAIHT